MAACKDTLSGDTQRCNGEMRRKHVTSAAGHPFHVDIVAEQIKTVITAGK
jgi:hypothetical protein